MTTTPLTDQQLVDAVADAITADAMKPRAERIGLIHAMLAVVQPELDRLAARRGLYRAAWMNARNRAAGHQQRYRYERKLCHSADIRATGAIRAQLAAEQKRDDLAAELGRVRAELATTQAALAEATKPPVVEYCGFCHASHVDCRC